jgi:hypothetical protein
MPKLDKIILNEYLIDGSDFRRAADAVDKIYGGLMGGLYKIILADCETETTVRKLHQRIMELNNAVKRSEKNEKKLVKEIDKLRLDISSLKNNLIEFLLMVRNRVNNFNGIYERTCTEYGLKIVANESDKSILRWDHLRPDPSTVLGSLKYIEDFFTEIEDFKQVSINNLKNINSELHTFGTGIDPEKIPEKSNFQQLRHNIDLILGTIDINGLCDLARSVSKFFNSATELIPISDSEQDLELNAKFAESKLKEFKIKYTIKGASVYLKLEEAVNLASLVAEETPCIITNIYQISAGFDNLKSLITNLKRLDLCLPLARAFMVKLSKDKNLIETDASEKFSRFAAKIPIGIEQTNNYVTAAGTFKNIVKGIEMGMRF